MHTPSSTSFLHGTTPPTRASVRRRGSARFIPPWKAFDAHTMTLVQRADRKIHRSRKNPTLTDVTSMRRWVYPGASQDTMVQDFLIPWLQGAYRHVYKGPWFPGQHACYTKPPVHLSPPPRPIYDKAMYEQTHAIGGLGFLRPLPASVVWNICLYIGHVKEKDGTH